VAGVLVVTAMSPVSAMLHPAVTGMSTTPYRSWGGLSLGVLGVAGLDRSLRDLAVMVTMIMHVTLSLSSLVLCATVNLSTYTDDEA
jgi:hypothetical protein